MVYDLQSFGLPDMIDAGRRLRHSDTRFDCMETAATSLVDFFYDNLREKKAPELPVPSLANCVLVRCFKTHPFGDLPPYLQRKAAALLPGQQPSPNMQCLTLLATRGEQPEWNSRHMSSSHQVIPLATVEAVSQAPMISQLVLQLGSTIEHVVSPATQPVKPQPTFDVFHVESALGSGMVPDQKEFVQRFGVKSVLGFGGLLPAGELFAIILFTRVRISPETAALFRTLALGVKLTLLPYSGKQVFAELGA